MGRLAATAFLPRASALHRPCCLIVEDQALIALSIEEGLEEIGYGAAGPFRSGADALDWLRTHTPDIAILDYSLADGACTRLAQELLQRRIPFLVYSGYPRHTSLPSEFERAPWIEKPCPAEDILAAIRLMTWPNHAPWEPFQ